jgi:hypothetical protein
MNGRSIIPDAFRQRFPGDFSHRLGDGLFLTARVEYPGLTGSSLACLRGLWPDFGSMIYCEEKK